MCPWPWPWPWLLVALLTQLFNIQRMLLTVILADVMFGVRPAVSVESRSSGVNTNSCVPAVEGVVCVDGKVR